MGCPTSRSAGAADYGFFGRAAVAIPDRAARTPLTVTQTHLRFLPLESVNRARSPSDLPTQASMACCSGGLLPPGGVVSPDEGPPVAWAWANWQMNTVDVAASSASRRKDIDFMVSLRAPVKTGEML